jgi:hypothetical protein
MKLRYKSRRVMQKLANTVPGFRTDDVALLLKCGTEAQFEGLDYRTTCACDVAEWRTRARYWRIGPDPCSL